ncbi:MAG: thiol reductase thioredoxin, partial [Deltaproteobacteria bacterium]|nr:thiol reductase thioredoxin [Deltaproteobacteria bacterium]
MPHVVRERGAYDREQPGGRWELLDAQGQVLATRELGEPLHDEEFGETESIAEELRPAAEWAALAQARLKSGKVVEAVLAQSRAAGRGGEVDLLLAMLSRVALPRTAAQAAQVAADATSSGPNQEASPVAMANALVLGGDPAELMRALAVAFDNMNGSLVALDLIHAAMLVAPKRTDLTFHHALVLASLGLDGLALEDTKLLAQSGDPERASLLERYFKVLFPRSFDFWPAAERLEVPEEGPEIQQPLQSVRKVVQKYATRLTLLRQALQQRFAPDAQPVWIPPAVDALLPSGPVKLEARQFEDEEGDEITVDERLELHHAPVPWLIRQARADWSALTWLLWAAGANGLTLPARLAPPKEFAGGANAVLAKLDRCSSDESE